MKYCPDCGTALISKVDGIDGETPYCPHCQKFVYPTFNSAISTIILNHNKDHILLIEQYGRPANILVAGYVMKGEDDITTLVREVKEEVDLDVYGYYYNDNSYFKKTNTLIHNYISVVKDDDVHITDEVDAYKWMSFDEALAKIKPHSLAEHFLQEAIKKLPTLLKTEPEKDLSARIWG